MKLGYSRIDLDKLTVIDVMNKILDYFIGDIWACWSIAWKISRGSNLMFRIFFWPILLGVVAHAIGNAREFTK